jgi:hypothetical protein
MIEIMSDLVTVEVEEIESKLTQVWIDRINKVLLTHYKRNYKRDWCAYSFGDCAIEPPLAAWVYLGKKLGYELAWAHDRFAQWKPRGGKRIRSNNSN